MTGDAVDAPYDANTEFANWTKRHAGVGANRANAGVVIDTGSEAAQLEGLQVTQNSPAGMSVLLNIGAALVDGTLYWNDSALTLAIATNASGNPRIDTVVLRKSWVGQTVRAVVLAGTPAASPTPPALTQSAGVTWEIPIADVRVANGAVSITNSNVTSRAFLIGASPSVMLDRLNNNSGAVMQSGDWAVFDPTADRAIAALAGTGISQSRRLGVLQGRYAAGALNANVVNRGICQVQTSGAVTRGQFVNFAISATTASGSDVPTVLSCGVFLETTIGAGLALAWIDAGRMDSYGFYSAQRLAAPAALVAVTVDTPFTPSTIIVEFFLRTVAAAVGELINLSFNPAALATSYYSYAPTIANSAPALAANQNLGAVAAIQFSVPANTATAGYFAFGRVMISHIEGTAIIHHITGHCYFQTGNGNGNLFVQQIGGRYSQVNIIGNVSFASASGANLATGSYMNVYARQA